MRLVPGRRVLLVSPRGETECYRAGVRNKIRVLNVPLRRAKARVGRLTLPRSKQVATATGAEKTAAARAEDDAPALDRSSRGG